MGSGRPLGPLISSRCDSPYQLLRALFQLRFPAASASSGRPAPAALQFQTVGDAGSGSHVPPIYMRGDDDLQRFSSASCVHEGEAVRRAELFSNRSSKALGQAIVAPCPYLHQSSWSAGRTRPVLILRKPASTQEQWYKTCGQRFHTQSFAPPMDVRNGSKVDIRLDRTRRYSLSLRASDVRAWRAAASVTRSA